MSTPAYDNGTAADLTAANPLVLGAFTIAAGARGYVFISQNVDTNSVTGVSTTVLGVPTGEVWTARSFNDNNSAGNNLICYSCPSCLGGSTVFSIAQSSAIAARVDVVTYAGAVGDEGFANNVTVHGSYSSLASGNVVTGGLNRRVVGAVRPNLNSVTITAASGETVRQLAATRLQVEDIAKPAQGTYTITWNFGAASTDVSWVAFALYGLVGGGGGGHLSGNFQTLSGGL